EEVRDRRLALVSEATAAEEAVQAAEEALDKLVASQRERDADFLAAKKALEVKQTELDRARADAKSASAALAQARARREVSELRKRLTNIREQERRAVEAQATIESITVSAEPPGHDLGGSCGPRILRDAHFGDQIAQAFDVLGADGDR